MANLFEKPIAAHPMSEFVALPLQFIDTALQRKQIYQEKAKAEIAAQDNSLLKLQYLSGDSQRHHELQKQFEDRLNTIVDSANGDYSNILPQLDRFSRELKYETTQGELGHQQDNFNAAMKMKEDQDKRLAEGKTSEEGYKLFLQSIGQHKTIQNEDGTFSRFQGYTPSTITDPIKGIQDGIDEIKAKYDEEGMQYVSPELIKTNVMNKLRNDSNTVKALKEKAAFQTDSNGNPIQFNNYLDQVLSGVISDKSYYEKAKTTDSNGDAPGMVMKDVGMPSYIKGDFNYTGGSSPLLKKITAFFGSDSWKEHRESVNDPMMQRRIKYIEAKTGTKFPDTPVEQRNWLIDNFEKDKTGEVSTRGATKTERNAINNRGQLRNTNAAVFDRAGRQLNSEQIKAIQGTSKSTNGTNKISFISNVVTSGGAYPPGTLVMVSHNGESYFIEPSDPKVINSPEFNNALINMASETNTGMKTVTLRSNVDEIPMGTYEVEHIPNSTNYNLYQNGKLVYRKFVSNGDVYGVPVNKEE